jgi:glycosyltransferase involved in cell wall biosynthesis
MIYRTDAELMGAIQQIASSPALRDQLGENGYTALVRYWTREPHLEQYFEFLEQAASRNFGQVPWKPAQTQG